MLEIVQQIKPIDSVIEEVAHTPALPWLVKRLPEAREFADLDESDVDVLMLDAYGADTWSVLAESGHILPESVYATQDACRYDNEQHVAFYPVALLTHGQTPCFANTTSYSAPELGLYHEKGRRELAEERLGVSPAARLQLGTGHSELFPAERGVSLLSLMELELSDGSALLGWGWRWFRK